MGLLIDLGLNPNYNIIHFMYTTKGLDQKMVGKANNVKESKHLIYSFIYLKKD